MYPKISYYVPSRSAWAPCLRFECNWDVNDCDTYEETNFDGPKPPCCTHIMRDMARVFDNIMSCELGLEYFVSFGMLLGFERADKIIPWTTDNDYLMTIDNIIAMVDLWNTTATTTHGLQIVYDMLWRVCVTPEFGNRRLLQWQTTNETHYYPSHDDPIRNYVFSDIFDLYDHNETTMMDIRECYHDVKAMRPAVLRTVYNGTVTQSFPANPDSILTTYYGHDWRVPKTGGGGTHCGRRRAKAATRMTVHTTTKK